MFEYYLVTYPKWGYTTYQGFLTPINDVFITNCKEKAKEVYRSKYAVGEPCKISVPIPEGKTIKQMRRKIYDKYKNSKSELGIKIKVKQHWVD